MAYANFKKRNMQMQKANMLQQQKAEESSFPCFKSSEQDFGAKQMTSFFEENNKNLTKKWSCDEDGVAMSSKWFPTSRVRTFSFGEVFSEGPFH